MSRLRNFIFILIIIAQAGCITHKTVTPAYDNPKAEYTAATIINYTVDGCTWLFILENGTKLEPINLKDEYKKDKLKVWIKYKPYKGNSICMAGEMVTIIDMFKE